MAMGKAGDGGRAGAEAYQLHVEGQTHGDSEAPSLNNACMSSAVSTHKHSLFALN